ncbi:MAG: hypothetical protein LBG81_04780 [Coriobacteriaceae bacterium]|nr:hypothetical protein [Coriobacteriaceae bacterium]
MGKQDDPSLNDESFEEDALDEGLEEDALDEEDEDFEEDAFDAEGSGEDEPAEEDDEYDLGITKETVSAATNDFNAIYKEGAAAAKELKDAFNDIKSAFNLGGLFK